MSDGSIRVLYLNHTSMIGGAGKSLLYMIRAFPAGAVTPCVLTPEGALAKVFRDSGVLVYSCPSPPGIGSSAGTPTRGLRLLKQMNLPGLYFSNRCLEAAISDFKPDLIHLNERFLLPAAWASKRAGIPVVMHARNVADRDSRRLHKLTICLLRKYADKIITIDESVRRSLREVENCTTIYNPGWEKVRTENSSRRLVYSDRQREPIRFLFLSVLRDFKGIWEFLHAARILKEDSRLKFVIAGGNSRAPEYYERLYSGLLGRLGFAPNVERQVLDFITKYELSNVEFLGRVDDIQTVLSTIDVNVFPSWLNGPSRSVFECGIRGIPSIVALRDRIEDVVKHGETGWIISEKDPEALAQAMVTLGTDRRLRRRMGMTCRERFLLQFEPERKAREVLDVYNSLLDKRSKTEGTTFSELEGP